MDKQIPNWIWGIIIFLVLVVIGLFLIMNEDVKNNAELSNTEKLCIEQCSLNQDVCVNMVRVFDEKTYDDCSSAFSSCISTC